MPTVGVRVHGEESHVRKAIALMQEAGLRVNYDGRVTPNSNGGVRAYSRMVVIAVRASEVPVPESP